MKQLINKLEKELSTFRCWADDSNACDAANEGASALETLKLAIKTGTDTEYAIRRGNRAIKLLKEYE